MTLSTVLTRCPLLSSSLPTKLCNVFNSIAKFSINSCKSQIYSYSGKVMASSDKITAPYGSWKSPITSDVVSGGEKRLGGSAVDSSGHFFWLESRPNESGRSVLVKEPEKPEDQPVDITPKDFAVRTVAQDYGGGAFTICGDNIIIFSNYKDQTLYKQSILSDGSLPVPITPDYGKPDVSYADGIFDSRFNRYVTVMEDRRESSLNPATTIVTISLRDNNIEEPKVLVGGSDFYAFPRINPMGDRLAWIEWSHPNMPWDKSELWVGHISENGDVSERVCVAGCDPTLVESPTEPKWSSKGIIHNLLSVNTVYCYLNAGCFLEGMTTILENNALVELKIPWKK